MTSQKWAERLIAAELSTIIAVTGPIAARIVARLEQHRLLREFYYLPGEVNEPRTS